MSTYHLRNMLHGVVLCFAVLAVCLGDSPPKWPETYKISGVLRLPYAEIEEPFSAWYEADKHRSRINYYGKTVSTIYLDSESSSKPGSFYKIEPTFQGGKLKTGCFLTNWTSGPLSVLPDLTGFKNMGEEKLGELSCTVWQNVLIQEQKKNTYTFWTTVKGAHPVRYEMMGYDTLLGSHYDKYYLDYDPMDSTNISFPDSTFEPQKGLKCGDFPGPGVTGQGITMNPISEYVQPDDSHIDGMFDQFQKVHSKQYADDKETQGRKHTFRQNVRYIHSKNREGLSYQLGVNHLADMTRGELRGMRGYKYSRPEPIYVTPGKTYPEVPNDFDWRLRGAVTPVKDQAACGSCWSFGTVATIEGAYFLKTGKLVRLSEQELMDCSWDQGNNACDGGEDFRAYKWIEKYGLSTTDSYGPYLGQDGYCHYWNASRLVKITGFMSLPAGDTQALKVAIFQSGPISVAIDASHDSMKFYMNGVYYEPKCGSKADNLDHAVLAVGYGTLDGEDYWLIKNSWSTYWGNDGYILMSQKDNNCGVATAASYVTL